MYGVILAAAMMTGQSAPDLHWKGCHGGHGCGNYGAAYGGCYGGCYGGWESLAPIHTPAGCWGMPYSGYGPSWPGYACAGGCGGYQSAAYGVPSQMIANPAPEMAPLPTRDPELTDKPKEKAKDKTKEKAKNPVDDDDNQVSASNRARVIVSLPANGKLFVDNTPIRNAAEIKTFRTPELSKGQQYFYEMRAEVLVDGKVVTQTRRVTLTAGDLIRADFSTLGKSSDVAANAR